ncbi:uncharacterized protein BDZ99DRAFT_577573 [Mytilinidion resinicola]|uniref:mRNA N(6)-methyladenine demethylase n=1 Tax=Mytilinidion resinicola TaxID=574789 RepID=A0A6A6XY05_9PEZI|nr:uncharacterized protein BDZ99DRAFT_577573 [Mytilinidion resinicola]KAF2801431.1 hypothetical protein BDZ99DRAFT_577573 [Mytilinidion resinicola]
MDDGKTRHNGNDTHALPPQSICDMYRKYQKMDDAAVDGDLHIIDFNRGLTEDQQMQLIAVDIIPSELIASAEKAFKNHGKTTNGDLVEAESLPPACTVYEHKEFPGLRLFPSLLPPESQWLMLDHLLHRELSIPLHTNNLSQDYTIPYPPHLADATSPLSFFTYPQNNKHPAFIPINPLSSHKTLNTAQFLQKKLRWLTLGSQYNWSTRSYPPSSPTPFPADLAELVTTLFKASFKPESGVVLLYSPKDYMPVHRDVSEESPRGLASFTLGCDGLFIIAKEDLPREEREQGDEPEAPPHHASSKNSKSDSPKQPMVVIRVRSGDVVQMDGPTRWAWHAMPKVMAGTCPESLHAWPVKEGGGAPKEYARWKGYMRSKRLNISCRQVWEGPTNDMDG